MIKLILGFRLSMEDNNKYIYGRLRKKIILKAKKKYKVYKEAYKVSTENLKQKREKYQPNLNNTYK